MHFHSETPPFMGGLLPSSPLHRCQEVRNLLLVAYSVFKPSTVCHWSPRGDPVVPFATFWPCSSSFGSCPSLTLQALGSSVCVGSAASGSRWTLLWVGCAPLSPHLHHAPNPVWVSISTHWESVPGLTCAWLLGGQQLETCSLFQFSSALGTVSISGRHRGLSPPLWLSCSLS